MKIAVITVSDRASRGEYADRSGPAVVEELSRAAPDAELVTEVVPDGVESVLAALRSHEDADWILTTGGTGTGPRDHTPEATRAFVDRAVPGLAEYLRARSLEQTPFAVFSRAEAGLRGRTYVVNLPGSEKGARFCARLLVPLLRHGVMMAAGESHAPLPPSDD
jgi:molybdopterin adenylyltransferase